MGHLLSANLLWNPGVKKKIKKEWKKRKESNFRFDIKITSEENITSYVTVSHPWFFSSGFLSKRCHSVSAIANQSENTLLQEQSLQQENQLYEFLRNIQQAKADDSTWAPGDTR